MISTDTHVFMKFTSKRMFFFVELFLQTEKTQFYHSSSLLSIMPGPGDSLYKPGGYFGVQSACLFERGIRSQTGPSVVQLGWLNEISGSNINSSASLMRTMRGNCFSKERHYIAPHVGIGPPCLQRLLGTEGLKQYTIPASTLLCSARLSSLTLRPASQEFFFFISLIFWNKDPKEKCTSGIRRPNFQMCACVCVG